MDELYALLNQVRSGELTAVEAATRLERPHRWVWAAMDPVTKLLVSVVVGDRTLAMAQSLVHAVVNVLAPGVVPLFLTDGLAHYATAILTHFGHWVAVPPRSELGPKPKPRWLPIPELLYAQFKKRRRRKRVVRTCKKITSTFDGV
jgi:transposase-like protein